jgi:hypothetical protein
MEEMRIEFLRESFITYVNIVSGLSGDEREVCIFNHDKNLLQNAFHMITDHHFHIKSLERITKCVERTNITQDIDTFIDEQGTGPMIPGKLLCKYTFFSLQWRLMPVVSRTTGIHKFFL